MSVPDQFREVAIIDDNDDAREQLCDELTEADYTPQGLAGSFSDLPSLVDAARTAGRAAICDHHLISNYSPCNGATVVASLYQRQFPAILYTAWSVASIDQIRPHLRHLPVLLTPDDADVDSFAAGWEICCREFGGEFTPVRRPWRTSLYIEDVDESFVNVSIPGWNSSEVVRFPKEMIPPEYKDRLLAGERFFAQVNKGAEDQSELYFDQFEFPE